MENTCESNLRMIVITGGPCGGKSTFMSRAHRHLTERGIKVIILGEVATEFINAGISPLEEWKDPLAFQEHVLRYQLDREERYIEAALSLKTDRQIVILCDSASLDGEGYVDSKAVFEKMLYRLKIKRHELLVRYATVIHLVTAADGALEHYTLETNPARTESPEKAIAIDQKRREAWLGHPHHCIIRNHQIFERKMLRAFRVLARVLNMPVPLEKERKFIVRNFTHGMVPGNAVQIMVRQDYLFDTSEADERRIRVWQSASGKSYIYTEKKFTATSGVREELERHVDLAEYRSILRNERDLGSSVVLKTRYCFEFKGRHFELDLYRKPISNLAILEVELTDMNEQVKFPSDWILEEVTGRREYGNREIARKKIGSI